MNLQIRLVSCLTSDRHENVRLQKNCSC